MKDRHQSCSSLRPIHGRARPALVVAPYVGEFGWELMTWQGRVRWEVLRGRWQRVLICVPSGREALYDLNAATSTDGALVADVRFVPVETADAPGEASEDHRIAADGQPLNGERVAEYVRARCVAACESVGEHEIAYALRIGDSTRVHFMTPGYQGELWPTTDRHQRFVSYRRSRAVTLDVLLVPRTRNTAKERNQPESWWTDLADRLRERGLRVDIYAPALDEAIEQLSATRLAAGASTGGLHLASLCRCPHFVWGPGDERRWTRLRMTNQQRYETIWNPLGTPCRYEPWGWAPSMEAAELGIVRTLEQIGLSLGAGAQRDATNSRWRAAWRVRRGLSRLMYAPADSAVPWRLREFVRNSVV